MEDLVQGLQKGWTPGSLLQAKWRKWRKGSCQGWRPSSPRGPTQLSWPACVGLSWQRRRQSLGLPAGAPWTCILPRGSSDLAGPEQNRDSISASPQGDRQNPLLVFPSPRPIPTTSPASLDSTFCRVPCAHRGPSVTPSGAACSSRLTVAQGPSTREFPSMLPSCPFAPSFHQNPPLS